MTCPRCGRPGDTCEIYGCPLIRAERTGRPSNDSRFRHPPAPGSDGPVDTGWPYSDGDESGLDRTWER